MKRLVLILFLLVQTVVFFSCSDGGGGERNVQTPFVLPEIYHTPAEIDIFLNEINQNSNYSSFTKIETVGYSKEGREIKALIISNDPEEIQDEPRIRLTGGIHGNEMISVEILLNFIEYLCSENHKGTSRIVDLIDSRYIAIIPVLNPDGLIRGRRYNSNDIDLNRNFDSLSQPESAALSVYSKNKVFHSSITFHSGAVLINMPFDYKSKIIDNEYPEEYNLITSMALSYARGGFSSNPDVYTKVYNSDYGDYIDLVEGTINGGDWYVVTGSLQDWSYLHTGCIDMTVEVARSNPSTIEGIDAVYSYNQGSLLDYIEKAGYGVHGRVTSSAEPDGVKDVEITVVYDNGSGITGDIIVKTDSKGYYHRILGAGNYNLVFRKSGYSDKPFPGVSVPTDSSLTEQNVTLTTP